LPAPDGKAHRPFRVDEDGNVVYRDKEPSDPNPIAARQAPEQIRAGILSWGELNHIGEKSSGLSATPAMFVNLSDEPESTNWEMRDRQGRVIKRPDKARAGSRGGGRNGGGRGDGKSAPKTYPKPKKSNT